MIRAVFLLMLLANGLYFAWHQGHLAVLGWAPSSVTEPHRVGQQLKADGLKVLSPDAAKRLEALANKPLECLISAPLEPTQVQALRDALPQLVGALGWQIDVSTEPARWIAYMGKYANADALTRKKAELRQLGVNFELLRRADLEPGLSLGTAATRAEAEQLLASAAQRGVRTGRVLEERAATQVERLLLPAVDAALRAKLVEVKAIAGVTQLQTCKAPA